MMHTNSKSEPIESFKRDVNHNKVIMIIFQYIFQYIYTLNFEIEPINSGITGSLSHVFTFSITMDLKKYLLDIRDRKKRTKNRQKLVGIF